jgi:RNA polymerase-binding transcription factor DksA
MGDEKFPASETVSRISGDGLHATCDFCQQPIDLERRRAIKRRRFCCDEHRWAWHRDRRLAVQEELQRLVELVGSKR